MDTLDEIADDYSRHARSDFVGLWQIASRVRDDLGLTDNADVRTETLLVVKRLLERGLRPGDYLGTGFAPWDENSADSIIARITNEWDAGRGDPTLADPICWFARPSE
jgi:hypothetical protein